MNVDDVLGATGGDKTEGERILRALSDKIAERGYTAEDVGRIARINYHETAMKLKDADGTETPFVQDLHGFTLDTSWETGPEWPVVQPATPVRVPVTKRKASPNSVRVTAVHPDQQVGFRRVDGDVIPTHDRDAIDAAMALTKALKPDRIMNLGDYLDLPEWSSKFLITPDLAETTQPAIQEGYELLARQRAICDAVDVMEGNHDDRMALTLANNARAAFGLKRATDLDGVTDGWPVLSLPNLLRMDELGVTYHDGYPANRTKLATGTDELTPLFAIHGEKLDMMKLAKESRQSYMQGHIHRRSEHWETYEVDGRPTLVGAITPGCLCRVDGAVPSTKSSRTRPNHVTRWESWQQGMAIVTEYDDGSWTHEIIPIHRGRAWYRHKTYDAA